MTNVGLLLVENPFQSCLAKKFARAIDLAVMVLWGGLSAHLGRANGRMRGGYLSAGGGAIAAERFRFELAVIENHSGIGLMDKTVDHGRVSWTGPLNRDLMSTQVGSRQSLGAYSAERLGNLNSKN